jgi:anthranilate synthase component I
MKYMQARYDHASQAAEDTCSRIIPVNSGSAMLTPDYRSFLELSRNATLIPVAKTLSADLLTPVGAFLSIAARQKYAFLLESVEGGEKIGRYTFLGAQPSTVITARGQEISIREGSSTRRSRGNVIEVLRRHLKQHTPATIPGLPPFTSGGVGYFAYDMVRQFERLPESAKDDTQVPDCIFTFYDRLLAFDHLRHQVHIIAAADVRAESPRKAYDRALADIAVIEDKLARGLRGQRLHWSDDGAAKPKPIKVHHGTSHDHFVKSVRRAKEYIAAGDIFQVVLSQRLDFKPPAEPFQIYRALRTVNPSPYMFFLKLDDMHVLGASPEMLVRVSGRKLEYRPIAGTHKRGVDAAEDERLIEQLRNDEKERAEHVMLVDLGRNDLGRVSEYGSVKVGDLMYVEKYSHVMHLVSALEGRLRDDLDAFDALAACFPAGTLSGAPKIRAMEIIEELEPVRRGVYGGSVLYADHAGNLDSCIAIRTMVLHKNRAYVQAGAGIVADSDPESEYQECMNKASALLRACEKARD